MKLVFPFFPLDPQPHHSVNKMMPSKLTDCFAGWSGRGCADCVVAGATTLFSGRSSCYAAALCQATVSLEKGELLCLVSTLPAHSEGPQPASHCGRQGLWSLPELRNCLLILGTCLTSINFCFLISRRQITTPNWYSTVLT